MTRNTIASITLVLAALGFFALPQHFSENGDAAGQLPKRRNVARPQPSGGSKIDYSTFLHATKQHQETCNSCHKVPTANPQKVSAFPDVADFPDHDACVRCHRRQFFKGVQPIICTDCHTKTSARNDQRWEFRNPKRPQQFTIEFPHDKHQDVIASLRLRPATSAPAIVKSAHVIDDKARKYNNCTICHAYRRAPVVPAGGWIDDYVPPADTFKSAPTSHDMCFNCHWQGQEPTKEDCAGCHKPAAVPNMPVESPKRLSMKFRHESREPHIAECTTCHINITKSTTLRGLKPDVPIFPSCAESSCHQNKLNDEWNKVNNAPGTFKCDFCHTSDVGIKKPPNSHRQAVLGG